MADERSLRDDRTRGSCAFKRGFKLCQIAIAALRVQSVSSSAASISGSELNGFKVYFLAFAFFFSEITH